MDIRPTDDRSRSGRKRFEQWIDEHWQELLNAIIASLVASLLSTMITFLLLNAAVSPFTQPDVRIVEENELEDGGYVFEIANLGDQTATDLSILVREKNPTPEYEPMSRDIEYLQPGRRQEFRFNLTKNESITEVSYYESTVVDGHRYDELCGELANATQYELRTGENVIEQNKTVTYNETGFLKWRGDVVARFIEKKRVGTTIEGKEYIIRVRNEERTLINRTFHYPSWTGFGADNDDDGWGAGSRGSGHPETVSITKGIATCSLSD